MFRHSPISFIRGTSIDALRSGLFLASYVALIKVGACLTRHLRQRTGIVSTVDALFYGFCTGFSVLFEKRCVARRRNDVIQIFVEQVTKTQLFLETNNLI